MQIKQLSNLALELLQKFHHASGNFLLFYVFNSSEMFGRDFIFFRLVNKTFLNADWMLNENLREIATTWALNKCKENFLNI